ncbi:sedoheptulokinase-like [Spea bombifrons]|uniref:sedoheptulokinase-like n=1 Tax=Spea bombifrons TaxID=233779 RepID=UPI0023492772|nr:sedoheptulokinase-like [Spea bombifrons]
MEGVGKEQNVSRIIQALSNFLAALPRENLKRVSRIGISGQMHGVVFWKANQGCHWINSGDLRIFEPREASHLVTWEDGRCTTEFLSSLPQPHSHLSLATGFGCATIFWYLQNRKDFLQCYDAAGTIQDYVVSMLCGLERPKMSVQNAASWGYFNTRTKTWNVDLLEASGFPIVLLPDIEDSGCIAGKLSCEWCGISHGTEVGVALGDFQCSVYSSASESTDAVLNVSTSAQLTFSMPEGFQPEDVPRSGEAVAYFPYFNNRYLAVAASLNGGNVVASFVAMLSQWISDLGLNIPDSEIYAQAIKAALSQSETCLTVCPTLFGERHTPNSHASVSNIAATDLSLGHVTRALCRGIIKNLHAMLPSHRLQEYGVKRIIGSGSALARNEVLRQEVEKIFPFPLVYGNDVDSALGAALVMIKQR